jgi:hypothetical protein
MELKLNFFTKQGESDMKSLSKLHPEPETEPQATEEV